MAHSPVPETAAVFTTLVVRIGSPTAWPFSTFMSFAVTVYALPPKRFEYAIVSVTATP